MTKDSLPRHSRAFHWNAAAWFGAQIGSTFWLLLGAAILLFRAPELAAVWLGAYFLLNLVGVVLWMRRDRILAYTGFQIFLALFGAIAFGAITSADLAGQLPSIGASGPNGRLIAYSSLLVVPWLMLTFYRHERAGRGAVAETD